MHTVADVRMLSGSRCCSPKCTTIDNHVIGTCRSEHLEKFLNPNVCKQSGSRQAAGGLWYHRPVRPRNGASANKNVLAPVSRPSLGPTMPAACKRLSNIWTLSLKHKHRMPQSGARCRHLPQRSRSELMSAKDPGHIVHHVSWLIITTYRRCTDSGRRSTDHHW